MRKLNHNPIVSSHELKYEVEEPPTHGSPQTAQYYCTEEYCRKRTDRLSILTDQAQHRVLLDCHESVSKEPLSFEPHQHNPRPSGPQLYNPKHRCTLQQNCGILIIWPTWWIAFLRDFRPRYSVAMMSRVGLEEIVRGDWRVVCPVRDMVPYIIARWEYDPGSSVLLFSNIHYSQSTCDII